MVTCVVETSPFPEHHKADNIVEKVPCYSGQVWKVQTYFPYHLIDSIFINVATLLIRPAATSTGTKLMQNPLDKVSTLVLFECS